MENDYRKNEIVEAIKWFKSHNIVSVDDNYFERDSSPQAWLHYNNKYHLKFGDDIQNWFKNQPENHRAPDKISKSNNRIKCELSMEKCVFIETGKAIFFFGGDTDFNFKNIRYKNKGEQTAFHRFAETINNGIIEEILNTETCVWEAKLKNIELDGRVKNQLKLLENCKDIHHSLLNFSLMQITGNLQGIKKRCDCDRFDAFLNFLHEYYKTNSKKRLEKLKEKKQSHYEATENLKTLQDYLDRFGNIYNYCAKIYFLPTKEYFTGEMIEKGINSTVENWQEEWLPLLEKNSDLIDNLIKSGKEPLYTPERIIDYMLLAVRFWQAKETHFNLMDKLIDQ